MGFGARLDARLLCGAALLALTAFGSAAHAADNAYNIPAQPLDRALRAFGDQSGVTILADTELRALWLHELAAMQARIAGNRTLLADGLAARNPGRDFTYIVRQNGMFSYSGLTEAQVAWLRAERAIYMVKGGRINVAGLLPATLPYVCDAITESLRLFP